MSFRFALPNVQPEARAHRDEDTSAARLTASRSRNGLSRAAAESSGASYANDLATPPRRSAPSSSADSATASTPAVSASAMLPAPRRRHVVTPDPVALRYLEEEPSVTVVDRRVSLQGYELYMVEQWACSRKSPTLVITTYTGDPHHAVVVGVLSVPADAGDWPPRLRAYFQAMQQFHARPKETPFGEVMATNLSSFPSALTVIAVPDGDVRRHGQEFIVNEDLKRLGCSGRSALALARPTRAAQEKFQSLYRTSDKIPFAESVLELIKLCQTALVLFGLLDAQYVDGLLCDVTEAAISDWWTGVGAEHYNAEPADGILGPTTVAALLGMLLGARNRLAWLGAPVTKDVFDLDNMKKGLGSFQKTYKLERTRRLDHHTLHRLHSLTSKAAAGEGGWGVQRAIKSTVEGFGGKRGEIVMGMVSGRDKGNVGDVETLDFDRFLSLLYGERPKWLWYGKPRRSLAGTAAAAAAAAAGSLSLPPSSSSPADHFSDRATNMADLGNALFGKDKDEPPPQPQPEQPQPPPAPALTPPGPVSSAGTPARRSASAPLEGTDDTGGLASAASVPSGGAGAGAATAGSDADADGPSPPPAAWGAALNSSISDSPDRDPRSRRTVFKSVAGKVSDARSGLGRIRDAVGGNRRGHTSGGSGGGRPFRDDAPPSGASGSTPLPMTSSSTPGILSGGGGGGGTSSGGSVGAADETPAMPGRAFTWKNKPEEYLASFRRERERERDGAADDTIPEAGDGEPAPASAASDSRRGSGGSGGGGGPSRRRRFSSTGWTAADAAAAAANGRSVAAAAAKAAKAALLEARLVPQIPGIRGQQMVRGHHGGGGGGAATTALSTADTSAAGSVAGDEADLEGPILGAERRVGRSVVSLLRRHSLAEERRAAPKLPYAVVWQRRLSFSAAEEAVLAWEEIVAFATDEEDEEEDEVEDDDDDDEGGRDDDGEEKNAIRPRSFREDGHADSSDDDEREQPDDEDDSSDGGDAVEDEDEDDRPDDGADDDNTEADRRHHYHHHHQNQQVVAAAAGAAAAGMLARYGNNAHSATAHFAAGGIGGGGGVGGSGGGGGGGGGDGGVGRRQQALAAEQALYGSVAALQTAVGRAVLGRVAALEALDAQYGRQLDEVQGVFVQLSSAYERVQESSEEILGLERAQAAEAVREVEMLLARVEYEMGLLASKVQDVDEGVQQFGQQVADVERRADELKEQLQTESWAHWFVRTLTGIGTGPNIVGGG